MNEPNETFEGWAILELFGHSQIAGPGGEAVIGGKSFVRVDVPAVDDQQGFTKFYGGDAIYAITPVSEEVARLAVKRLAIKPVSIWMPEINRQLPPLTVDYDDGVPF